MTNCNFCKLPDRTGAPDILAKMLEIQKKGINVSISTAKVNGGTPAFRIRMYVDGVEIVKYRYFYDAPFLEMVIDSMVEELKRGRG